MHPLHHSRAPSFTPAPPLPLHHPLRPSRARSTIPAPPPPCLHRLRQSRAPSAIPAPPSAIPHPLRHSPAPSVIPAPLPPSLHHLPSFLRRQESMRAASIREQRRCSTASRTSRAPPPSLPRPLRHPSAHSVIPAPVRHSRARSATPAPSPSSLHHLPSFLRRQESMRAGVDSRTAPMLDGLPYVRAPPPSLPRPSIIPAPAPSLPSALLRHSRAPSAIPAPFPSFLRRQESRRAARIREQRRCSTASRSSERPRRPPGGPAARWRRRGTWVVA